MWKYFAQVRFQEISIAFVNAWGSLCPVPTYITQCRETRRKTLCGKEMDVAMQFQGEKTLFIGEHPTAVDDCLKRFALAMGASVMNLARSARRKNGLTLSKRGPKGLKEWYCLTDIQRPDLRRKWAERHQLRTSRKFSKNQVGITS
jgi:hypothetical protein